jgi:16S rRNA (cytidine1402-2'-O)-methyltransferase
LRVVPIPGASAVLAALTLSGLPSDTFLFAGFLPVKEGQRRARLESLGHAPATLIFFESPRRLAASLAAMAGILGGARPAAVTRELTKAFEERRAGTLDELAAHYAEAGAPKGEVAVCVGPPLAETAQGLDLDRLLLSLVAEMPASRAAAEAARMTGEPKPALYKRLLELKEKPGD